MKLKSLLALCFLFFSCCTFAFNPPALQNGAIIGTLMVLNKNEIAAANLALKRNVNHDIRGYALLMQHDHTQNLQMWQALSHRLHINPTWSPTSRHLKAQGAAELAKLQTLNNRQFQNAYVSAMVKGHTEALALIDQKLLMNTHNPVIIKKLKATRNTVAYHLQRAKQLQ